MLVEVDDLPSDGHSGRLPELVPTNSLNAGSPPSRSWPFPTTAEVIESIRPANI